MRYRWIGWAVCSIGCLLPEFVDAQFNILGGNHLRTNAAITQGVTIGNIPAVPAPTQAFQVRGELLGAGNTPEVFRTNAPTTANTFWRMYQGGTTAGFERGQLFADPANFHFNINSPNGHLQLHTQNVQRARLNGNLTGPIGPTPALEFPNINRDGFFLISGMSNAFTNAASRAPFTRLHLIDNVGNATDPVNYAQQDGYRPWQRNPSYLGAGSITFTGNSDQSYIGHKYDINDNTDFVVQWSDNPNGSPWGTDRMKFVFTTRFSASATKGAATTSGMEAMRFWPKNSTEVNVGIGDFAPAAVGDPTERVDILDGKLRIRQLPTDPPSAGNEYVTVNTTTGVLEHRPLPPSATTNCEWVPSSINQKLITSYLDPNTNGNCPDRRWKLGIGTSAPEYKVEVFHDETDAGGAGGLSVDFRANSGAWRKGISCLLQPVNSSAALGYSNSIHGELRNSGLASPGICTGTAVKGKANTSEPRYLTNSVAVDGEALASNGTISNLKGGLFSATGNGATISDGIGVHGTVKQNGTGSMTRAIGVLGDASGGTTNYAVYGYTSGSGSNWAGYFVGPAYCTSGMWTGSDESLKSDIVEAPVDQVRDVIRSLQVHRYRYNVEEFPHMNLPEGEQIGLLAGELEQVVPGLVREATQPEQKDEEGNVVHPDVNFKAVNYTGLIPYLIEGLQQQQQRLDDQDARIAEFQHQLAACCSRTDADRAQPQPTNTGTELNAADTRLRIQPNPMVDRTTVFYTLEHAGRMQLLANSADGKEVRVLQEAAQEKGEYQFEWNTTDMSPEVYYVTLLLDRAPIVKKAVKVAR